MFDVFYWGQKPGLFAFEQPAESLDDAASKSRTAHYWYIYGGNDYTGFDFDYVPVPWETDHIHTWPSQWQPDGGVYLANKHQRGNINYRQEQTVRRLPNKDLWHVPDNIDDSEFDYSWHPNTAEPNYEYHFPTQWQREGGPVYPGHAGKKYMTDQRIRAGATQIFYMDFLNQTSRHQYDLLKLDHPDIKLTRYVDNHLNVFKRIMNLATTEYVWIISSICDYTQFDFNWHPSEAQKEMIHCFPSNGNRRGDTFYIHVPSFTQQMIELEMLDWFNVINYCEDQAVSWFAMPVHYYDTDDLVTEIKNYDFKFPYTLFTNQPDVKAEAAMTLWAHKDRVVERLTRSGATAIVPRDIKADLKTQIYDYAYISDEKPVLYEYYKDKTFPGLDIVYISNGEPDEERWYNHLVYMSNTNDIKWVRGITGRTAAYQEAARQSTTPWFFAVFAKLEVVSFEWDWMPDYFQQPKHYIFNAHNPVNGLEYGHQGIIAYNKRLVLENTTPGIDFTLSQPHESVPILSGIAHYNQTPWMTWRTAFREVIKLKYFMETNPTIETQHRLDVWCDVNCLESVEHAEWSVRGALDAVAYYTEVAGNYEKLKFSFDWAWLEQRFNAGNR